MVNLKVSGMNCGHCKASVEKALKGVPGVTDVEVSLKNGSVAVSGNPAPESLIQAVEAVGYDAQLADANA